MVCDSTPPHHSGLFAQIFLFVIVDAGSLSDPPSTDRGREVVGDQDANFTIERLSQKWQSLHTSNTYQVRRHDLD